MKRSLAERLRISESGATAVEFALLIVPLLLFVFGAIELGRALWSRNALQDVAMAAARCMGVKEASCAPSGTYSASSTTAHVQSIAATRGLTIPSSGIVLNNNATCTTLSGFSQVTLSYTFRTAVPLLLTPLAAGIPLTGSACFPNQT